MKLNWYFWQIYFPIQLVSIFAVLLAISQGIQINWYLVFLAWFLIGPVGVGVGFHRLFSHRQFKTWKPVEYTLAILGTLSTYTPLLYWIAEHQHHHIHVDTDKDINNPKKGFWHSFLYWRFTEEALKAVHVRDRCSIIASNDSKLTWINKNFKYIVYSYGLITALLGLEYFLALFIIPVFIEQIRINILNSISHINIPGSYQNYKDKDSSYNHVFLGYITFGFGWHNNHHAKPRELINHVRWWEVDIEGLIAQGLQKHD
jgi:stearoyl-CoA desaturase (delta-9 desaturase)